MPSTSYPRRPISISVWLAAAVAVVAAVIAAVHLSGGPAGDSVGLSAANAKWHRTCPTSTAQVNVWSKTGTYVDKRGATQHLGDGQVPAGTKKGCPPPVAATTAPSTTDPSGTTPATDPASTEAGSTDPTATTAPPTTAPATAPPALNILAKDCSQSQLPPHTGFQIAPACVSTAFGEVTSQDKDPSLLISSAPRSVRVGATFTLSVSTRNLVRDRFLAAGQGGYYVESSLLNADGLVRGHFHTACRMLASTTTAPDPAPVPAFFVATEDGKGGATPDTVQITVAGMPTAGTAECAVWAGDGSHRIPMMARANQIPAFDVVRIRVR